MSVISLNLMLSNGEFTDQEEGQTLSICLSNCPSTIYSK